MRKLISYCFYYIFNVNQVHIIYICPDIYNNGQDNIYIMILIGYVVCPEWTEQKHEFI